MKKKNDLNIDQKMLADALISGDWNAVAIEILEKSRDDMIYKYILFNKKKKLMEFLSSGLDILKFMGLKALLMPQNIFGIDETTYRLVGAITQITSMTGQYMINQWIAKNDIPEGKLKLIIDKLNSIIHDRIGEEIFPQLKQKQDLDQILQSVEDELSKIDLSEGDRDID